MLESSTVACPYSSSHSDPMLTAQEVSVYERFRPQRVAYGTSSLPIRKETDHSVVVSFPSSSAVVFGVLRDT